MRSPLKPHSEQRINSGWFGNSVTVPQAGEITASFGTRGFCLTASALGFESCGTYKGIIDMYKKTGGPDDGIDSIKKLGALPSSRN